MTLFMFSIDVNGSPRKLFTIEERPQSGDLTIIFKSAQFATNKPGYEAGPDSEFIRNKWSVHTRPLEDGVTQVNYTQITAGEKKEQRRFYISATRTIGMVAPIFDCRTPTLDNERYLFSPSKNSRIVTLGKYDPIGFQLFYSVYVGRVETSVFWTRKGDTNACHLAFSKLRIIVLWSFWGMPSNTTSDFTTMDSSRPRMAEANLPTVLRDYINLISKGLSVDDLKHCFIISRSLLRQRHINQIAEIEAVKKTLTEADWFFSKADAGTPAHIHHLQTVKNTWDKHSLKPLS